MASGAGAGAGAGATAAVRKHRRAPRLRLALARVDAMGAKTERSARAAGGERRPSGVGWSEGRRDAAVRATACCLAVSLADSV